MESKIRNRFKFKKEENIAIDDSEILPEISSWVEKKNKNCDEHDSKQSAHPPNSKKDEFLKSIHCAKERNARIIRILKKHLPEHRHQSPNPQTECPGYNNAETLQVENSLTFTEVYFNKTNRQCKAYEARSHSLTPPKKQMNNLSQYLTIRKSPILMRSRKNVEKGKKYSGLLEERKSSRKQDLALKYTFVVEERRVKGCRNSLMKSRQMLMVKKQKQIVHYDFD